MQGDGLAAVLLDLDDLLRGHVEFLGQLLRGGLAAQVLEHLALHARELVDDLDHVHRDTDGAGLVGHRAGDRLTDPPGGVRGELVALGVVELLDRADQTEVALLDEVQEEHAAAGVTLGQGDHQTEVGLQEVVLGAAAVLGDDLQLALELGGELVGVGQLVLGEQAGLDAFGELDLLLGVEEGDLADLLEVVLDGVGGGTGGGDLLRGRVVLVLVGEYEAGALGALGLVPGLAGVSSVASSSTGSASSFLALVFLAAAVVFLAATFLATAFLAGAVFLAATCWAAPSSTGASATGAAVVAVAVAFLAVTVFAATVLVAVRLAGLFAATLFRVRLGSAALTISVTPSSSRIWLRLRSTFFH